MDDTAYEVQVTVAGTAVWIESTPGHRSRMPVACRECDVRTDLTLAARGEDAWITCPAGHTTRDWRLSSEAVHDVAAAAIEAGVAAAPADAEVWLRVTARTDALPDYEDIA
ncbi:hypothetical protein OG413_46785 [Streptomyces sp. NBC_01433]|uniref:hypothetical protein n=1 Tax=Streptomyces sp. NBC_01433 TaxID=2903864 RepID=UPI002255DE54|nr:hypothetical protein [Streptomyces sp. NBC_01433]MCX4682655.1 hypothetical protein [Streptomyces sp. NBC_01433]MCX4682695.1 hypothetical protein [Streptomyces sp. NBC_01433]